MHSADFEQFRQAMADLCVAFGRTQTDDLNRVYWESCKYMHIAEFVRNAERCRRTLKRFPTPKDLIGERDRPVPAKPKQDEPEMSRYAIAANKMLMHLAYRDKRRGFVPLGGELLAKALAVKADFVRMAEDAEREGQPWTPDEFNSTLQDALEHTLGTSSLAAKSVA